MKFGIESEALLSFVEMKFVRYNYEITDGYIASFFAKFKQFKTLIHSHPRIFCRRLQRSRNRHFRELVELEFGIQIPPKPLSKVQRLENNRLSDSDRDNDTDSELPDADSELDDGMLPDIGKDLWDLLGNFFKVWYATRWVGHPCATYKSESNHHACVCTVSFVCRMCLPVSDDCRLWVGTETVRRPEGNHEIASEAQAMPPRQRRTAFTSSTRS